MVLLLVLAGCTDEPSSAASSPAPDAGASADPTDDDGADASAAAARDAVFLTAVESAIASTSYEGLVDEQPGELLTLADAVCRRLDDGSGLDDVLLVIIEAFADEASEEPGPEADATLAGAVVGAAVETGCPQHGLLLD